MRLPLLAVCTENLIRALIGVGSRRRSASLKLLIYQAMEGAILDAYLHPEIPLTPKNGD
jgi:hypothetical protein